MATFGERLKQLRQDKKLTQVQMAEMFSLNSRSYQNYEMDSSTPHFATLIALADFFEVSLDDLVGREFPKP